MLEDKRRLHLIGIGGSGMSALAKVLVEAGYEVSGSDIAASKGTAALAALGVQIRIGHSAANVVGADLVIISSAIQPDNPEVQQAAVLGVPIVKRSAILGELTRQQRSILVAGTHGKTTTSSMIAVLLQRTGYDPTFLIGGEVLDLNTSAKLGRGPYLVAEADEFDRTFLHLTPWTAVITNIEPDHLDYYKTIDDIVTAFTQFVEKVPADGHIIACWDDARLRRVLRKLNNVVSYGLDQGAQWRATQVRPNKHGGNDFIVEYEGRRQTELSLSVPGRHNVRNALASIIVASLIGIECSVAATILTDFRGAARRFEYKGSAVGIDVYDDYAHHPTEIAATLQAARERHSGRICAVFQPHTYSRTKHLLKEFARALEVADRVIVTDIYAPAGRETETFDISAADIVREMNHPAAAYVPTLEETTRMLLSQLRAGDLLVTMGAGDIHKVATAVLNELQSGSKEE